MNLRPVSILCITPTARNDRKAIGGRRVATVINRSLQNKLADISVALGVMLGSATASQPNRQHKDERVNTHKRSMLPNN